MATSASVLVAVGLSLVAFAVADQEQVPDPPRREPALPATPERIVEKRIQPSVATMARSRPVSISIPSIRVQSRVGNVGLKPDGTVEVPSGAGYDNAAWYRHSPSPGSLGPAIMLGHVDSKERGPSVFYRLAQLRHGDRISIERDDGTVAIFTVDSIGRYPKKRFPTKTVYGDTDHAALRLVTCGGAFDSSTGSYVDNVVVFASLAQSTQGAGTVPA